PESASPAQIAAAHSAPSPSPFPATLPAAPAVTPPAPPQAESRTVAPPRVPSPPSVPEVSAAADADSAEQPAASGDVPKGTRLIQYLDAHAPDTHAALLRVSLQTGLPLTLLRMPDSLSDDEFAQVEESVRRILGVDQLNF
ncbi:MAG: hypothetical protein AAGC55_17055, partial [Myxococcota bacterium]